MNAMYEAMNWVFHVTKWSRVEELKANDGRGWKKRWVVGKKMGDRKEVSRILCNRLRG